MGLGTWQLSVEQCRRSVLKALEIGYRHVDTAQFYKNEAGVGAALAESGVPREEVWVATKVWVTRLSPKRAKRSVDDSLRRLKTDHVDLLYVHWPALLYKARKTLTAFAEMVDEGKVRHVCVSNFTPSLVDEAIDACPKPIFANQVEHHPFLRQEELRRHLSEKGIHLVAYSPLARGKVTRSEEVLQVARKHGVTPARVTLAWHLAHGSRPIPKATSEEHLRDNWEAQNLELDGEDLTLIDSIDEVVRIFNPPVLRPKW